MDAMLIKEQMIRSHGKRIVDAGSMSQRCCRLMCLFLLLINLSTVTEARRFPQPIAVMEGAPDPPARLVVKIPDLAIDFELQEFTNPAVVIQTVYRRIIDEVPKGWYGLKSWSSSNYGDVVAGLKRAARVKVHFSIPGSDWAYTLNLSEVVSGLALPKLPIPEKYLRMPIAITIDDTVNKIGDGFDDVPSPWYLYQ
uniref:Putative 2b protein n=1 Tax=Spinach latent virus TaxID=42680 RepID=A0A1W6S3U4_9BROM|nr:putative 2b protein [Spinach latent virus]QUU43739.1 putative 2b protein [Spinach latent virus]UKD49506.1 2b protein [Spinach latent virus]